MENLKLKLRKHRKIIAFIFCITIFIFIAEDVFEKEIFGFDSTIYNFLVERRNVPLNWFFTTITEFGSAEVLFIITFISVIFMKKKLYKIMIPLNLTTIGILNFILKHIFVRPRPNELRLIEENGYSFPSGHAMASTAFYGFFIFLIYKNIENKKTRNILIFILTLLIFLIDISRIYVGVHYTSDVLGGTCLSISYLVIIIIMIEKRLEKNNG